MKVPRHDLPKMILELVLTGMQSSGELFDVFFWDFDLVEECVISSGVEFVVGCADIDTVLQNSVSQQFALPVARKVTIAHIPDIEANVAASHIDMLRRLPPPLSTGAPTFLNILLDDDLYAKPPSARLQAK